MTRPTASVQGLDRRPLDRDQYASALAEQADAAGPAEGDRVWLTYGDGSTVQGRWAFVGGDVEGMALLTDDAACTATSPARCAARSCTAPTGRGWPCSPRTRRRSSARCSTTSPASTVASKWASWPQSGGAPVPRLGT